MQQLSIYSTKINIIITMELIGTSKVADQNKTTIIENVAKILKIQKGDMLAFLQLKSGDIIIKKMSDVELNEVKLL